MIKIHEHYIKPWWESDWASSELCRNPMHHTEKCLPRCFRTTREIRQFNFTRIIVHTVYISRVCRVCLSIERDETRRGILSDRKRGSSLKTARGFTTIFIRFLICLYLEHSSTVVAVSCFRRYSLSITLSPLSPSEYHYPGCIASTAKNLSEIS